MAPTIRKTWNRIKDALTEDLDRDVGRYWDLCTDDDRVRDQSHWCGAARWSKERWLAYGDFHFDLARQYLEQNGDPHFLGSMPNKTALEWGSGGGANIHPLCGYYALVYGVEVSQASLDQCARQMRELGHANFRGVLIPSDDPESALRHLPPGSIDFILSVGVFKHFPSKAYAQRVLNIFALLLGPGAYALIQIRHDDGSEKYRQKDRDYARNMLTMTSFTRPAFADQLAKAGLILLRTERDPAEEGENHEYCFIRKG